jgi:hypothetical protein
MTNEEFCDFLLMLGLTNDEIAEQLDVDTKTIRRWKRGDVAVPARVQEALRAWEHLESMGLPWRVGEELIGICDASEVREQIARYRESSIGLSDILKRVEKRGGPAAPWEVDLERKSAQLGPIQVRFYRLVNGGFSPATYRRRDDQSTMERDKYLLEDAYACIAAAIAEERSSRKKHRSR